MLQADSIIVATADSVVTFKLADLRQTWAEIWNWEALAITGMRVLGALAVGLLALWVLKLVLRRVEKALRGPDGGAVTLQEQRALTVLGLVRSVGMVLIGVLLVFMLLGALGVNLGPLLAGAGVVGLAVSFGAQSLVKDVIAGLFILFENQFGVGDVIRIEGVSGSVEKMTLRVVVLRDVYGVVHTVPNGEIKKVSNLTRTWARVVLDVGVAYREDPDRVMEVLRQVGQELAADPDWGPLLVDPPEVPGVESFGDSAVSIRMWAKTLPLKQWDVARELRRRIKLRFDQEGIEIPFPQQTVQWTGEHVPVLARVSVSGAGDDEAGDAPPPPSESDGGDGDE